jgi:hypothetical protein
MRFWLVRGCVLAVLNAAAQTGLSAVAVYHPAELALLRPLALGLLAGVGVLWGALDTWFDRLDRGVNWVKAAILAGLLAGVLGVVGKSAFVDATGTWALGEALTGGAAFTALLVLVPAGVGLLLGRLLGPRRTSSRRGGGHRKGARSAAQAGQVGSARVRVPLGRRDREDRRGVGLRRRGGADRAEPAVGEEQSERPVG